MTRTAQDMVHQKGFDLVMMARISCTYVRACMRTCSNFDFAQKDLPLSLSLPFVRSCDACTPAGMYVHRPACTLDEQVSELGGIYLAGMEIEARR